MAARSDRGVSRVLEKLKASVASGNYYEAHQMYRTLYFRLLTQHKYDELLEMLFEGAQLLLSHDQQESGADLAILFIEVLVKATAAVERVWIEKVSKLFSLINSSIPERDTYLTNATRWAMHGTNRGNPAFHTNIAKIFWEEKNYRSARWHFLHSSDGKSHAELLIYRHTTDGFPAEVDLFITQAVLHSLCFRNKALAVDTFRYYTEQHPAIKNTEGIPYSTPLLNYVWFLLQTIEMKNVDLFNEMTKVYNPHISRDPEFFLFIEKIGQIYFGIPPPKSKKNGLFGNLIQSFLSGLEVDESSSDEDATPPIVRQLESAELE